MDFLKQIVQQKQKEVQEKKQLLTQTNNKELNIKYVRRKDLHVIEEQKQQEERETKRRKKEENEIKHLEMLSHSNSNNKNDHNSINNSNDNNNNETDEERYISPQEVKKRLRAMGQPITFFGESDAKRRERLKQLELTQHERVAGSTGAANLYHEILQQEVAKEILEAQAAALEQDRGSTNIDSEEKKARLLKKAAKYEADRHKDHFRAVEEYCLYFFKRMLKLWENELAARDEAEKRSTQGQHASATQKQTRHNMKPLFKLLKNRTVPEDILPQIIKIVDNCRIAQYKKAEEAYLTLAIGNSPWPMGVTMVGIHERSGREKLFSQNVAHVLNDEVQRKYIQGIKRLMTYSMLKVNTSDNNNNNNDNNNNNNNNNHHDNNNNDNNNSNLYE